MIDETAIRVALEAPLGLTAASPVGIFNGIPVTRINETCDARGLHVRTYFIREKRRELYKGIRRVPGMFGILVHVPTNDGIAAAEDIAKLIPPLYRTSDITDTVLSGLVTVREVSLMAAYRGIDEDKGGQAWLIVPVQIDWRVDITR